MKTLAIDTSATAATAAVIEDGTLIGTTTLNLKKPHSQKIMPVIEELLKLLELEPADIDLFAAAHGPGSFTGLRIGVAAMKGFSDALSKPAVGVSTVEAMALPFFDSGCLICPMLDARREQVYYGVYKNNGELDTIMEPDCSDINNLLSRLACLNKKVLFTGDCVHKYSEYIKKHLGDNGVLTPPAYCVNNAVNVALLAEKMYNKKNNLSLSPDYILKAYISGQDLS